jgi:glycosidase
MGETPHVDVVGSSWIRDAVIYGVIPSRFGRDGLPAVTRRLEELQNLGVNTLWISPVNEATPGDFGYEVLDHTKLRADYGRPEDLRGLVRAAHARGMKVLLDFVPNHVFDEHRWYRDVERRGQASPWWDWFDRGADGEVTHYFDWSHLANLDYDNPKVRAYITDAMLGWVRRYDVDGFRIDAAWAVQQRRPDFWPELRRRLDETKPGAMLLAEASARDPYWGRSGIDAAYDWGTDLGHWAWEGIFDGRGVGAAKVERLDRAIAASIDAGRGASALTMRFVDNNDTGERFATRNGADMAKLGAALTLTLPGIPLIYTGQDVGASYKPYDEAAPISFVDRHGIRPAIRRLTRLRSEIPALRSAQWARYERASAPGTYGYTRGAAGPGQALVLFNFSTRAHEVPVDGAMRDELSGDEFHPAPSGTATVTLAPRSVRVLLASG